MIYQGSKAKLRKYIVPFLQDCIDEHRITEYLEPFVGGANVIDHIRCADRYGSDSNIELVALLEYMQKDPEITMVPEHCGFEHYKDVRENRKLGTDKYTVEYTALIGYFASYGGRYFDGGYGRDKRGGREIYSERLDYARKQAPLLKGISFSCHEYHEWAEITNAVVYLDPPYKGTKMYSGKGFNSDRFYDFARRISRLNYVFISEFEMPQDFQCIWSKERKVLQKSDRKNGDVAVEKLFTIGLSAEWVKNKQKDIRGKIWNLTNQKYTRH